MRDKKREASDQRRTSLQDARIQDVSSSSFFSRWQPGIAAAPIPVLINPLYDARYISAFELSRA
jgi:hypothetical protein